MSNLFFFDSDEADLAAELAARADVAARAAARAASLPLRRPARVAPPAPADADAAVAAFLASRGVTVCPARFGSAVAGA